MPAATTGQRRVRIRFERRAAADDGAGNTVGDWAALCGPFLMRRRPIKGREEVLQQRLAGMQPYELVARSCAALRAVNAGDRAKDAAGQTYDVLAIDNPDERNQELVFLVKAGAADG